MARARATSSRPAPSTTAERGGTAAVKEQRRHQQHQRYYQGLSERERAEYDRGAETAETSERRQRHRDQAQRLIPSGARSVAQDGAGLILGLIAWGWVVLPFLKSGAPGVKAVLMAKFLNKSADGKDLP